MRRFSAQYILTNTGPMLKRAVIVADDDGTILCVEDSSGKLNESHSTEFYNGIIIPGFVNCLPLPGSSHLINAATDAPALPGLLAFPTGAPAYSSDVMQIEEKREIVFGIDCSAHDPLLSMFNEIKILQQKFPAIPLAEMVRWATINGARALGEEEFFGTIETGKKPGLLLLEDVDLQNLRLLPESRVTRLI